MGKSRIQELLRQRVRYRITRGGALYVTAIGLTGLGAFLSGNNLIFLIFSAMLALFLVSGFLSRMVLAGLEIELLVPKHVAARTPAKACVRIRNLKLLTPSFSIELAGRNKDSILSRPVYFPLIAGKQEVEAEVLVVFPKRGRHRENLFVISTRFPFGFLTKSATVTLVRDTLVYPALEPREGGEVLLDSIAGEIHTQLRGPGQDFYRIRPYESNDNARHVDWKSSAHTGGLQVREFARDQTKTVEIYLDRRVPAEQKAEFERLVEKCAFLVWQLNERDTRMWLRSQSFAMALPEEGDVWDLLKFLALVEPLAVADAAMAEAVDRENLFVWLRV